MDDIRSQLPGTFYTKKEGKVYYEHDKPLTRVADMADYECTAETPSAAYTFNKETNTIEKYDHDHEGATKHLVIPSQFNIDGVCYPVLHIGRGAFMVGDYFDVITIPEGIITIEPGAFEGVIADKIILPSTVTEVDLSDTNIKEIVVNNQQSDSIQITKPSTSTPVEYTGRGHIEREYQYTVSSGGFSGENTGTSGSSITINGYTGSSSVVVIPPTIRVNGQDIPVTIIDTGVYQGKGLISVVLPEGLESIGDYAFARNQLRSVVIPKSVKDVGHYAFAFNEVYRGDWATSKDRVSTIRHIEILSDSTNNRYGDLDKLGNISNANGKLDVVGTTNLKNHVFIQDINNKDFDVITPDKVVGEDDSGSNHEMPDREDLEGYIAVSTNGYDTSNSPGPKQLVAGSWEAGFFGEVSVNELFTGTELAELVGITQGRTQFDDEPWLKFAIDGKVIFKAKKSFRYGISWNHIYSKGAVLGEKEVKKDGQKFKVRLIKGMNNDQSEWNRLIYPIHEKYDKDSGWGIKLTDKDLHTHRDHGGSGTSQWMQEIHSSGRVLRGNYGVSNSSWSDVGNMHSSLGWAPVLEVLPNAGS